MALNAAFLVSVTGPMQGRVRCTGSRDEFSRPLLPFTPLAPQEAMQKGGSGAAAKEGSNAGLLAGLGVGVVGLVALYAYLSSQYN